MLRFMLWLRVCHGRHRHSDGRSIVTRALQTVVREWDMRDIEQILDQRVVAVRQVTGVRGEEHLAVQRGAFDQLTGVALRITLTQPNPKNVEPHFSWKGDCVSTRVFPHLHRSLLRDLWDPGASPTGVKLPTMVGALQFSCLWLHPPLRQGRQTVRTHVRKHLPGILAILPRNLPDHQIQTINANRCRSDWVQLKNGCNREPVLLTPSGS
mmetsp:Transcript_80953/g.203709  ORF Transcript_80953/g.203709 Transcript_80953/m.203709 type:complete len:210 (+) Transcript_80953:1036-1665(+)